MRAHAFLGLLAFSLSSSIAAQIGGDGRDGPLAPTQDLTLDTNRGPWFFSRIAIPGGVRVTLTGGAPALLLCNGEVSIDGHLAADGAMPLSAAQGGIGGPGGFTGGHAGSSGGGPGGGRAGLAQCSGLFGCWAGGGGGGGHADPGTASSTILGGQGGAAYGANYPFEVRGGSGGGGTGVHALWPQVGGSGGGGAIVLLADGTITVRGRISAQGGAGLLVSGLGGGAGAGGSVLARSMRGLVLVGVIDARGGAGPDGGDGGRGFVRLESYGSAPVLTGGVSGLLRSAELPTLESRTQPRRGQTWELTSVSVPGDRMFLFLSLQAANLPLPPFGTLRLDPTSILFVDAQPCALSHDPIAFLHLPIVDDPRIAGLTLYLQAINLDTSAAQSRLSWGAVGVVQ